MVTGMTSRGMNVDVGDKFNNCWGLESGRARGGCKEVGTKKKKRSKERRECTNPNKLADHGWVGLRRAAVFLLKGSGRGPESKCA
jgi:hypothetical protein